MKTEKSKPFLNQFHEKFRDEVLSDFNSQEASEASSRSQVSSAPAAHIETIHDALHALTGGTISSTLTGTVRPYQLNNHNILLYFNLFKGLSDGALPAEDFNPSREYDKISTVKSLLNNDNSEIATTSKEYVQRAFNWLNGLVVAGEIDASEYVAKITEAEAARDSSATLRPIQKIYLASNTKALLESRGLEGTTSDGATEETVPSMRPSHAAATTVKSSQQER